MERPLFLTKRRLPKPIDHPIRGFRYLHCSGPVDNTKSWEYFDPIERCKTVIEKLRLKFDLHPPSYPTDYQAEVGDIARLTEWEQAILCEETL